MVKILDDILLVAKGSYNLQIEEHPFDLQTFVRETKNDMQSFAMLEGQSIEMRRENIFCRNVSGDFHRLRQVIHNLVSNAIKFSEDKIYLEVNQVKTFPEVLAVWRTCINVYPNSVPSLVEVSTFMADLSTSEGVKKDVVWAMFSVTDKGIGISGADMKKLGIAFTQLSSGRQKKYQGTGLGLNICNMLVSVMGGKLVMFSAVGKGSCFSFAVPIKINSSAHVADDETTLVKEDAREDLQKEFDSRGLRDKGVKVMVVDDSAINRKLCSRKVRRWMPSVTITECQSGVVALEEYQRSPSNVMGIFMDYHMHDMDGEFRGPIHLVLSFRYCNSLHFFSLKGDECTRRIREFETMSEAISHHVYIAGYTADVLEDSTGKLLSAGMNSVIPKPEPPRAVEDELKKMMDEFTSRENDDTP
jgi:CheY-like chemotaxis protein